MKKAMIKDNLITIKTTFKRFLSILLMSFLGVGFFAGIKATSPDMQITMDSYFEKLQVMDLEIISTLGLEDEDIQEIEKIDGVGKVVGSYSKDVISKFKDEEYVVQINAISQDINNLIIKSGKLPEKSNECVVEQAFIKNTKLNLGDEITLSDNDDFFNVKKLKIVGVVESPLYISRERGTTNIGAGTIEYYAYVPNSAIKSEVYTCIYVSLNENLYSFSEEYDEKIEELKNKVESLSEDRKTARYNKILNEANDKIADAQKELDDGKKTAEAEFADAQTKIDDGIAKINNAKEELSQNKKIADEKFAETEQTLIYSENQIEEAEATLEAKSIEAENTKKELQVRLEELEENKTQLENGIASLEYLYENEVDEAKKQIYKAQIDEYNKNLQDVENGIIQVNAGIKQIEVDPEKGKNEKELAKQQLEDGKLEFEAKKEETYSKLQDGQIQINSSQKEIDDAIQTLKEEKQKYEEEIKDAEKKIDDAKKELEKIEKPEWYILDRNSNLGFVSYSMDTERIENLAKIFPIMFFVVATLISLNSMTRMVEEQRVQIGTLKALGYTKAQIASKYILYSSLATVIGGLLGMTIGFKLLPTLIFQMYQMMYTMPPIMTPFNLKYAIIGLGISYLCIVGSTALACIKDLKEEPAELMRPKAPPPGKRVLLEKISFIWKRLSFTYKVTVRNMFRYKKRFLMTVIGVAGCTALIFVGFGLRDVINGIVTMQYDEVGKYDIRINVTENGNLEEITHIKNNEKIKDSIELNMQATEVINGENSLNDVQLVVVKDKSKINDFIKLRDRKTQEKYELDDENIIISEKLSKLLEIKVGDKIKLKNADEKEVECTVSHITENYIMHYVYMSDKLYEEKFNEKPKDNVILSKLVNLSNEEENVLAEDLLKDKNISSVKLSSATKTSFNETMENMKYIVWVLIISAGMLAIVVLYNLQNVNISERIRELATIKVLGFYDNEVYSYVTRETVILTFLGIVLGIIFGIFLNGAIIGTCELDMMMFPRKIKFLTFVLSTIITLVFSTIVNVITYFNLKKINMIESLKSIE